jgi:hypothetical protein
MLQIPPISVSVEIATSKDITESLLSTGSTRDNGFGGVALSETKSNPVLVPCLHWRSRGKHVKRLSLLLLLPVEVVVDISLPVA